MGSSSPLVCHSCWESKENWNGPCPHAMEVFEQGVRNGRASVGRPPEAKGASGLVTIAPEEAKRLRGIAREFRTAHRNEDGMITVSDEAADQLSLFLDGIADRTQSDEQS